jgi:hypothetical protein
VSSSRVAALVCTRCGNDLVYVELAASRWDSQRRLRLDRWHSVWFGCDCPERPRLSFADTYGIVETGGGHETKVERWGPQQKTKPRRRMAA